MRDGGGEVSDGLEGTPADVSEIGVELAATALTLAEQVSLDRLALRSATTHPTTYMQCTSPTCGAILFIDPTTTADHHDGLVQCPICYHAWCLTCNADTIHAGLTCAEYKSRQQLSLVKRNELDADRTFDQFLALRKWTRCPRCATPSEKIDGCNKVVCGGCQKPFCYRCGKELKRKSAYDHYGELKGGCYGKLFDEIE
ncbi:E3 ubiquitin-protein ligase rnf14, partial [Borealophlyctis nickersoniae]